MALNSYYLAAGTLSKATLIGSSSNNIENWPMQSDQPSPAYGWCEPMRGLTQRPTPARLAENADLSLRKDGFFSMAWGFAYFTTGQLAYVMATFFGGANDYVTPSTPVTLQTWFDSAYVAFTTTMYRPVWGTNGQYDTEDGGYKNVVLRFVKGTIIT